MNLRKTVWSAVQDYVTSSEYEYEIYEEVILQVLIFIRNYNNKNLKMSDIASNIEFVNNELLNKKEENINFTEFKNYIKEIKKNTILKMLDDEISTLYNIYEDSEKYVNYSSVYFNAEMYKLPKKLRNISITNKLKNIHYKIVQPVIEYYKNKTDIKDNQVDLLYFHDTLEVRVHIDGINPNTILKDILMMNIFIPLKGVPQVIDSKYVSLLV